MFDVIAIGSATKDKFLMGDYKLIDWPETPSQKAIVLPWGEKFGVNDVYITIGGNAINASVTFARQGFKTACLAKLGDDSSAKELKARLKTEGVSIQLIAQTREKPTAFSVLLLKDGERTILSYHGASDTLRLEDINLKKLKSSWWYLSLAGESDVIYPNLIKFAKDNGIKVAFNPTGHHLQHKRDEIIGSLKDLAFLALNTSEASLLTGISFAEPAKVFRRLDEWTPGIVAVTDGDKGATVSDGKNIYRAGIFKEQKVIDRTGAGDSFGSGFVAGLMRTGDVKYALRLASANATSVVEHIGATEGVLTKGDFEKNPRWQNFPIEIKPL